MEKNALDYRRIYNLSSSTRGILLEQQVHWLLIILFLFRLLLLLLLFCFFSSAYFLLIKVKAHKALVNLVSANQIKILIVFIKKKVKNGSQNKFSFH